MLTGLAPGRSLAADSWTFAGSIPAQYADHVSWWDPMVIDPMNANVIYVPTFDEGLLKSTDGGVTWNLISTQQVDKIAISPSNPNIIYGGSFASGPVGPVVKSTDGGVTWTDITHGLPHSSNGWPYPAVSAIVIDPSNASIVYMGLTGNCSEAWKTTDGGNSWAFTGGPGCDTTDLAAAPTDPNIIYWAGRSPSPGTYIARTSDGASTWTYPSGAGVGLDNLFGYSADTVAVDYNNPNTVYASSINGNGLYKSTDGAATWTQISTSTVGWQNLATDPVRANSLYYAAPSGSNVFASSDGGASWSDITNNLPGGILKLEIPASNIDTLYAWTGSGIYTRGLGGQAPQSITFGTLPGHAYGTAPFPVSATASSGLTVSFSSDTPDVCTASGQTVTIAAAGTCTIRASQPGNTSYLAAPDVTQSFTVSQAALSITASSPAMTYGGTVPDITASYSGFVNGDGPGSFTTQPTCSTTATSTSTVGTYPATCSGAADPNYAIAYLPGIVTINQATPQISWPAPAAIAYGTPLSAAQLDATTSVPGAFSYSPGAGTVPQPGTQALTATFTPQDTTDYTPATASATVSVGFTRPCLTTTQSGSLTVAKGQAICIGPGGKVTGSVTVAVGGALWVSGGRIGGSLTSTGASGITVCGAKVTGSVAVTGTGGPVVMGGAGCPGDTFGGSVSIKASTAGVWLGNSQVPGSLTLSGNSGGLTATGNTVTGSATVGSNNGGVTFTNNTVTGSLTITNNTGGFTYTGNTIYGSITNSGNS